MSILSSMRQLDDTRGAVRVEDVYDTDVEDLWSACTRPERLARWIGEVTGDLRPGGEFRASWVSGWAGSGRIDVCEPPRHLALTLDPGTEAETRVEAWLRTQDEQTLLVVEERGLPLDDLPAHGAGWQAHLEDLARSLVGGASVWRERWTVLIPEYQRRDVE
ncbi:SRPBCC family protein [Brachybacterium sp. YJGR34]|uniref:SRPBCC family protein n=1 Tax=Brachybacterium sp. YJGR34 TaxID=2059911 RepID=UPI000E0BCD59|nr:SRPBCC family protein [Brachybacterium sp. YJGR34]